MEPSKKPLARLLALMLVAVMAAACEPLSMTMLSIGLGAGVSHQMNGLAARTFTAPLPRVKLATRQALRRMDIRVRTVRRTGSGEVLLARAGGRDIEVEIESLTPAATRVKAVARQDVILVDGATASEIIAQTGRALGV